MHKRRSHSSHSIAAGWLDIRVIHNIQHVFQRRKIEFFRLFGDVFLTFAIFHTLRPTLTRTNSTSRHLIYLHFLLTKKRTEKIFSK